MQPFDVLTGVAAPLLLDDVNTGTIAPSEFGRSLQPDYQALLFAHARRRPDGSQNPDFVLNRPPFRETRILVAGRNFGCGSARESVVWAMTANGIRCIIARSFGEIFRQNCLQNGVLPFVLAPGEAEAFERRVVAVDGAQPFTVDLRTERIHCPDGTVMGFSVAAAERTRLLEGLDDIGLSLKHADEIAAWERTAMQTRPWLQDPTETRG